MTPYFTQLLVFACVYALVAASVSITMGSAGLFTVSQAALYGVGAYTAALVEIHLGLDFLLVMLLSIAVAVAISVVTAFPALRLKAEYLVVGSLALQLVASAVFSQSSALGGADGLVNIPVPSVFGLAIEPNDFWIAALVVTAVAYALLYVVTGSPWGRLVRAIRDDEVAVAAIGKNVVTAKVSVIAIAGGAAGLAGALYACYVLYISPDDFSLQVSVGFLAVALIGGATRLEGSIVGAVLLVALPQLLRLVTLPPNVEGQLQELIYGGFLVMFMMFRPQGIVGDWTAWRRARSAAPGPALGGVAARAPGPVVQLAVPAQAAGEADEGVVARDVSVSFGGLKALRGASLSVPLGTVTALIGANGAGKTTLVDVLTGFVRPDEGQVSWQGRDVTVLGPQAMARLGMTRVFQEARVFRGLTAVENVLVGLPGQRREHLSLAFDLRPRVLRAERDARATAMGLLERVGLAEHASATAGRLSYGQQKLLCIARGLASGAQVLVLDEPSAGVSPVAIGRLRQTIGALAADGLGILLVEHNIDLVRSCAGVVAFMSQGQITMTGPPEQVLADENMGREYLGVGRPGLAEGAGSE
jgi:ABC-type branched-subunit amino acid transport system ATPase component/ABC-type branched-subunit amino acid transport system permease subunit